MRQLSTINLIGFVLVLTLLPSCTTKNKNYITLNLINHQLNTSIQHLTKLNENIYSTFANRVKDSVSYTTAWNKKALETKKATTELYDTIGDLKIAFIMRLENLSNPDQVEMETMSWITHKNDLLVAYNMFITEGRATVLRNHFHEYCALLENVIKPKDSHLRAILWESFQLYPNYNYEYDSMTWELENFDGITAIEVITNLTYLQNRVKTTEHLIISYLMHDQLGYMYKDLKESTIKKSSDTDLL